MSPSKPGSSAEPRISGTGATCHARVDLIGRLAKTAEDIDPHVLAPSQLKHPWSMDPTDLIDGALLEGKLRERRIILEAMEARTNRRLVRIAVGAAIGASLVGLAVPLLERLLGA